MHSRLQASCHDILTSIEEIEGFVRGKSLEKLRSDRSLQLILEREFEIIGEALFRLRHIAPDIFQNIPHANQIIGMRNIIAHGYDQIDYEILWDAATAEIAPLRLAMVKIVTEP